MATVMIGVDPAKRSHAMAVIDERETQLATLQVGNDTAGYRDMLRLARRWPERTWRLRQPPRPGTTGRFANFRTSPRTECSIPVRITSYRARSARPSNWMMRLAWSAFRWGQMDGECEC